MKALTVKDLERLCKQQILNGNGDKVIMISSDDEGNSYHYLWYAFETIEEYEQEEDYNGYKFKMNFTYNVDKISKKEDTIILG